MEIGVKDFSRCCRCCLAVVDKMRPLFGAALNEMLIKLMNVQVSPIDGYPQQMCPRCILKLSSAYTFYHMVLKNQNTLEHILKAAKENGEPLVADICDQKQTDKELQQELEINAICKGPSIQVQPLLQNNSDKETITPKQNVQRTSILRKGKYRQRSENGSDSSSENEERYRCSQCQHNSRTEEEFKNHLQTHLSTENASKIVDVYAHLCNICGARYRRRPALHKHLRGHRPRARRRCPRAGCGRTYAEAASLNMHLLSHSLDKKPFRCSVCPRTFSQPSARNKHARQHAAAAAEPLRCRCGKSFLHKYSLQRHFKNAHEHTECSVCKKTFPGKRILETHMKSHQKIELDSGNMKGPTVNMLSDLKVEFLCLICRTTFQTSESLEVHICGENISGPSPCNFVDNS